MRRADYHITDNKDTILATKHSWNATYKEVLRIIGDIAATERVGYSLTDRKCDKRGKDFVRREESWVSTKGVERKFVVTLGEE